jgi:hypothetical protein
MAEAAEYSDETYDAIMALGKVPVEWAQAERAAQALLSSVVKMRGSPWKDGMRTAAIEGLGRLHSETAAPLLIEELTDDNPAVVRAAARSIATILELKIAVTRIVEAATKGGAAVVDAYGRALRWLNRESVAEELGAIMLAGSAQHMESARLLLSELGGAVVFEKLRARTDSLKQYTSTLERAEEKIRDLFDRTVREAQNGFQIAVGMDVVVFLLGVGLLIASAWYAFGSAAQLNQWVGVTVTVTGGTGILGILYGTLIANPRRQVRDAVDHLMWLKIMFLAYLRRLHQADQAYTRRLLDDRSLTIEEVRWFSDVVAEIMQSTIQQQRDRAKEFQSTNT